MRSEAEQPMLFELPERVVAPAASSDEQRALAQRLPSQLYMGAMSWSFPGWRSLVYAESADPKLLSEAGLGAYAQHPLLRTVEIDRSFYEPLPARYFEQTSRQAPADFRFVVKAHEDCTVPQFPRHARYGKKQGQPNVRFLDASYATDTVVAPAVEGLADKLAVLLFQFSPQDAREPRAFADRLQAFLERLPRGVPYAVELRNPELLTRQYADALAATGAVHAHNVWGNMPSVLVQARLIPPAARRPLVVRWLMRKGDDYEGARSRFLPFSRLAEPDATNREDIATLLGKALAHHVPALVLVNNKAEGCAPLSIFELGRAVALKLAAPMP
jgi:uncharacterized protein YecE (DUF72 family)